MTLRIGTLAPKLGWFDFSVSVPFSEPEYQSFNIFFSARNGAWTEELRLKKIQMKWVTAVRVTRASLKGDKMRSDEIYRAVDKEYPLASDGSVNLAEEPMALPSK